MSLPNPIIVVDDDASMCLAIERLFHAAGCEVRTFLSAEELLESDAIPSASGFVLDIHLPGMSGLELNERLVAAGVRAPVVMITAHDSAAIAEEVKRSGVAGFLTKPFSGRELIATFTQTSEVA
jgi:FixJ family two-component response regulator